MFLIAKEFRFEAAHRIPGHPKCGNLHGHSYRAEVTILGPADPNTGMVLDFGELAPVKKWIDENLDHNTILHTFDPMAGLQHLTAKEIVVYHGVAGTNDIVARMRREDICPNPKKPWLLTEYPPTAEFLAMYIAQAVPHIMVQQFYELGLSVRMVKVWETATCSAVYTNPDLPDSPQRRMH